MTKDLVKLEREKRKTAREANFWHILGSPQVLGPLMGVGGALVIQQLGSSRAVNRDFAGFMLAAWTAYSAATAGIKDKYALGAITAAATAAYCVATPPTEEEAIITLPTVNMSKLLGGDGKLFWWDLSGLPVVGPWLATQ